MSIVYVIAWLTIGLCCDSGLRGAQASPEDFIRSIEIVPGEVMGAMVSDDPKFSTLVDHSKKFPNVPEVAALHAASSSKAFVYMREKRANDWNKVIYQCELIILTENVMFGSVRIPPAIYLSKIWSNGKYNHSLIPRAQSVAEAMRAMVFNALVQCAEKNGRIPVGSFCKDELDDSIFNHQLLQSKSEEVYKREGSNGSPGIKLYHRHFKPIKPIENPVQAPPAALQNGGLWSRWIVPYRRSLLLGITVVAAASLSYKYRALIARGWRG